MYKGFFIVLLGIGAMAWMLGNSGCASVVPPSGGPRDSLAPQVAHVEPANETKFFKDKRITFSFNEYVDLDNVYKNLIISPLPKVFPDVQRKLKTVVVKLKDSLQPNTTYVFNFTNVVKDVNEGNKVKDLLYVVSTGAYFDSLQLSGNVRMANNGKPDSTISVMLHTNMDDSAVAKERPRYVAHVDSSGNFLFRYLAPGTYRVYALKDESGSYLYTSNKQVFAFADNPVVLSPQPPPPLHLYAYSGEEEEKQPPQQPEGNKKEKRLKFTTNLQGTQQDLLEPLIITFENPLKIFDPAKMQLSTDSAFVTATGQKFSIDSTRRIVTMNVTWQEATRYNLILDKEFASDSSDRQLLKTDTLTFTTRAKKDYGQAKITFRNVDLSVNPVLLILQGGKVKDGFPITGNVLELALYNPGEYDLQILHDTNKNGKWDPGVFFTEHRQPEMVFPLDRKLIIKPNWSTEPEIIIKNSY